MRWAGNCWVDDALCVVCFQPECPNSRGGARPDPGALPSRLEPGGREYRGYGEWALHPAEAQFLLHRGFAIVDGRRAAVRFIHNEAHVTQIQVEASEAFFALEENFWKPDAPNHEEAHSNDPQRQ